MSKKIIIITAIIFITAETFAQEIFLKNNFADSLSVAQSKKLIVLTKNILLDCGHKETLENQQHLKNCGAAKRIYNFAAYMLKKDIPEKEIIEEIKLRNKTFFDTVVYKITPSSIRVSGDVNSPVEITAFIGSNCPSCKRTLIPLRELAGTALKGKIKISMKPLYRQLGDIALIAAEKQNKAWELFRTYGNSNSDINADNINSFFDEARIDKYKIYEDMRDTNWIFSILDQNYAESVKCKMSFTPHLLFNGIIYESDINPRWIIDFIEWLLTKSE